MLFYVTKFSYYYVFIVNSYFLEKHVKHWKQNNAIKKG